jgi:Flp pilus assembly protein TadD
VDHANTARSIEPWASSPYVQLGLLAELQGDNPGAVSRFSQAIDREDGNWELYLLRARAERKTGQLGAARSDVARARQLNPLGTTGPLSMFQTAPARRTG